MACTFSIEAMIRGYHVYKDIWNAALNEEFPCFREAFNRPARKHAVFAASFQPLGAADKLRSTLR